MNDLERRKQRRKEWFEKNGPCKHCGSSENLELHHEDPDAKGDHKVWSWRDERRKAELAKCIALCHECHLKVSNEYRRKIMTGNKHGTYRGYVSYNCRCNECTGAYLERQKKSRPALAPPKKPAKNPLTSAEIRALAKRNVWEHTA